MTKRNNLKEKKSKLDKIDYLKEQNSINNIVFESNKNYNIHQVDCTNESKWNNANVET